MKLTNGNPNILNSNIPEKGVYPYRIIKQQVSCSDYTKKRNTQISSIYNRFLQMPLACYFSQYPSGAPAFAPGFQWGSCYSICSLMCMFCRSLFVLFLLVIVLSVLHRFTDSDYPFGIFKLFLKLNTQRLSKRSFILKTFLFNVTQYAS